MVGASTVGGETQAVDRSPCAFGDPEAPPEASSWAYSRLEGNLQKPEGYVAHFSLDANAEQGDPFPRAGRPVVLSGARRRPGWPRTGSKRKRKAIGNESATAAATFLEPVTLTPSEMATSEPAPPLPLYRITLQKKGETISPNLFFRGKRGTQSFFYPEVRGSSVGVQ